MAIAAKNCAPLCSRPTPHQRLAHQVPEQRQADSPCARCDEPSAFPRQTANSGLFSVLQPPQRRPVAPASSLAQLVLYLAGVSRPEGLQEVSLMRSLHTQYTSGSCTTPQQNHKCATCTGPHPNMVAKCPQGSCDPKVTPFSPIISFSLPALLTAFPAQREQLPSH